MFTKTEAVILLEFLDRVTLTGHKERNAMNDITGKIIRNINEKEKEPVPTAGELQ